MLQSGLEASEKEKEVKCCNACSLADNLKWSGPEAFQSLAVLLQTAKVDCGLMQGFPAKMRRRDPCVPCRSTTTLRVHTDSISLKAYSTTEQRTFQLYSEMLRGLFSAQYPQWAVANLLLSACLAENGLA